jgi:hypothetical protein
VLKMVHIKNHVQQRMAITSLFTLQKRPDLLEYDLYVDNIPVETGI